MPIVRNKVKFRNQTFNAGLDNTSEPAIIKSPKATIAENCFINELGKTTQRYGLVIQGDNPATLISKWSFYASSAVDDIAASGNDGTATAVTYDDGKFGKAAVFNGTTSKIQVTADTSIDANSMVDFVITCWLYVDSDGENNLGAIFDKVGATTAGYRAWVHDEAADAVKISFEVQHATTDALVVTSTTIPIKTWAKLEFHSNADDSLDIYINGVVASYGTDTSGVGAKSDDSANDLYIGNRAAEDRTFDGMIQDLRVYDGTRSSTEYEQDKIYGLSRYTVGATIDRLYRIRDTNLERLDDDFKAWTEIDTGFTADKVTNFVQAKDLLFILNGTENVHSMDSSESITDEGNTNTDAPRTTLGAWAQNNRLFLSGSLTDSERDFVWFSDSLDPQTYDRATNVFKVRSGSSGKVTWLEPFKLNELIIYKEDSIFVLNMTGATPLTDWALQPINVSVGCKAGRTVQDIGNDQVFLDQEGKVRLLSRTTFDKLQTSVISSNVQDTLDTINIDSIDSACSWFVDDKYFLAIPTGTNTDNDTVLVWDVAAARLTGNLSNGWTIIPSGTWYPSIMASMEFGDNKTSLVVADNRTISQVYQGTGNIDIGKTIRMRVAGPDHDGGNRGSDKIWGPVTCVADAGTEATTLTIYAEIDRTGEVSIGTMDLSGGAPQLPIDLPFNLGGSDKAVDLFHVKQIGRGKTCRIIAEHNTYNKSATFNEYELYAEERIPRP